MMITIEGMQKMKAGALSASKLIAKLRIHLSICLSVFFGFILSITSSQAAVLAADRVDVLYHSYEGGGMKIDGPSILLRKRRQNLYRLPHIII